MVVRTEVLVARGELDGLHLLGRDIEHPGDEEREQEEVEEEIPGDPAVREAEERVECRLLGPATTAGKLTCISQVKQPRRRIHFTALANSKTDTLLSKIRKKESCPATNTPPVSQL